MQGGDALDSSRLMQDQTSSLALLGHRYYLHGMYAESAKLFEFILRHEPARSEHYFALGKALHALKKHKPAIGAYMRAIRLGQADADLHFYMGQCWLFLDRMDEAGHALETCLRLAGRQSQNESNLMHKAEQLLALVHRHKKKMARPVSLAPAAT
jgi:tetratricopeptide (TPR) repeat protein